MAIGTAPSGTRANASDNTKPWAECAGTGSTTWGCSAISPKGPWTIDRLIGYRILHNRKGCNLVGPHIVEARMAASASCSSPAWESLVLQRSVMPVCIPIEQKRWSLAVVVTAHDLRVLLPPNAQPAATGVAGLAIVDDGARLGKLNSRYGRRYRQMRLRAKRVISLSEPATSASSYGPSFTQPRASHSRWTGACYLCWRSLKSADISAACR